MIVYNIISFYYFSSEHTVLRMLADKSLTKTKFHSSHVQLVDNYTVEIWLHFNLLIVLRIIFTELSIRNCTKGPHSYNVWPKPGHSALVMTSDSPGNHEGLATPLGLHSILACLHTTFEHNVALNILKANVTNKHLALYLIIHVCMLFVEVCMI